MHLWEISIFSINNISIRPTKIMNRANKNWAHFWKTKYRKKIRKIQLIFDVEKWLWKYKFLEVVHNFGKLTMTWSSEKKLMVWCPTWSKYLWRYLRSSASAYRPGSKQEVNHLFFLEKKKSPWLKVTTLSTGLWFVPQQVALLIYHYISIKCRFENEWQKGGQLLALPNNVTK